MTPFGPACLRLTVLPSLFLLVAVAPAAIPYGSGVRLGNASTRMGLNTH
ncbi:hypothetical protein [Pseudomonas sp. MF6747]|nr:hypothetical protein [Pseudomonas sp. MF6747]MBK3509606.1 hypothetical protein [Pseudomonas sp. MF6747]